MIFIDIKSHKNSLLENTEYRSIFYYMHKRSKNKFDKFKIRKIEREREKEREREENKLGMEVYACYPRGKFKISEHILLYV
jgi:hypothetical protein